MTAQAVPRGAESAELPDGVGAQEAEHAGAGRERAQQVGVGGGGGRGLGAEGREGVDERGADEAAVRAGRAGPGEGEAGQGIPECRKMEAAY